MGVKVDLHIEELVLHGFAPGDRYRIGDALERELDRLFTEQGVPPSPRSSELAYLDGGAFEVEPGSGAEEIGVRVARAVYGGLSTRDVQLRAQDRATSAPKPVFMGENR